ncbi:hypothetical protein ABZU32_19095 [Sphaerisporangium sp. NPDC005288]|uniref:hypothetical protein n=1 Tax=Sphaerisporangium sp. NPDC005288 TaxID=3155114 RepID=UPI0033AD468F
MRRINGRSLSVYIGAAMTAGVLMAPALPAQADSHPGTSEDGSQVDFAFPSAPEGGGGGEVPEKKPRKEARKHYVKRPHKHYKHHAYKPEHGKTDVYDVYGGGGGGGGGRGHHGHHRHYHNGHFADDIYHTRHMRRFHSFNEARESLRRDARDWFRHKPEKAHSHEVHVKHEKPVAKKDAARRVE